MVALLRRQLRSGFLSWKWGVVAVATVLILLLQYRTAFYMPWKLPQPNPNFFNYMLLFSYFGRGSTIYLVVLPFLAAFIGGSIYSDERLSGRLSLVLPRTPHGRVVRTSLLSGFILGGSAGSTPLMVSLVIAVIHRPHMWFVEGVLNAYNYPLIDSRSWVYGLYRYNQILLLVLTVIYIFVLAGLMADVAVCVSFFTRMRYVEVLAPIVLTVAVWMGVGIFGVYGLCYINFLNFGVATRPPNELGAALTLPVLAAIVAMLYVRERAQDAL
ncbi:MAG: hypothetical protein SOI13_00165 [Bifidobacterium mongoliense]|jgi:hypothetical protein|uniref:hypothetical protein n=1 Tax=Bifidobacterium mongoliense TaxID=518643 RepID=UPI002F3551D8